MDPYGGGPHKRARLLDEFSAELDAQEQMRADGLIDDEGRLTPLGELRLHQLTIAKYWSTYIERKRRTRGKRDS
jgi:hypothetical protein